MVFNSDSPRNFRTLIQSTELTDGINLLNRNKIQFGNGAWNIKIHKIQFRFME